MFVETFRTFEHKTCFLEYLYMTRNEYIKIKQQKKHEADCMYDLYSFFIVTALTIHSTVWNPHIHTYTQDKPHRYNMK